MIVRGGDLVMFPHAAWHQVSGTPQRQPGMRLETTGDGPFTTVLCAMVEFEAGGLNPVMQALPAAIVVRSEDQGTSAELHALADAGCPVIQLEEPQIHLVAARGLVDDVINPEFMLKVFNNTVRGLRAKTEVWCHSCWGNPSQQKMFPKAQSYAPALEVMSRVDADVITFETCSSGGMDLAPIGKHIRNQKIGIGVIDHHTLQIERPEEVAALIRKALEHIPAERLVICSDCGMGREGMSRRHAFYKMVALVQGTNILRKELGLPLAASLAADPRFSLIRTT